MELSQAASTMRSVARLRTIEGLRRHVDDLTEVSNGLDFEAYQLRSAAGFNREQGEAEARLRYEPYVPSSNTEDAEFVADVLREHMRSIGDVIEVINDPRSGAEDARWATTLLAELASDIVYT